MYRIFGFLIFLSMTFSTNSFAQCPLSAEQRKWVEDGVTKFILDSVYVAGTTGIFPGGFPSKGSIGYALTLPGQINNNGRKETPGTLGTTSLINLCSAAKKFPDSCVSDNPANGSSGFLARHDFCVQLECEGRSVYTNHVYATIRGERAADENHVLDYTQPGGKLIFDPNPSITWQVDATNVQRVVITGDFSHRVDFISQGGDKLRLSRSGHVVMNAIGGVGLDTMALHVVFPALSGAPPVVAELSLQDHAAEQAEGTIVAAEEQLATITLRPGEAPEITWSETCME